MMACLSDPLIYYNRPMLLLHAIKNKRPLQNNVACFFHTKNAHLGA